MDRLSTKGQMIDQIDLRGVPHSGFDRSNHNYGTGKLGTIIPTRLDEVYPGDRIKGRPQDVTNFEPLAAPLMGSMVLKQESFFVPYHLLWKNAYKFFTGKNGFDGLMPAVTPQRIWDVFASSFEGALYSTIGDPNGNYTVLGALVAQLSVYRKNCEDQQGLKFSDIADATLYDYVNWTYTEALNVINNVFGSRKMVDLVIPALDSFKRFAESEELKIISDDFESIAPSYLHYLREVLPQRIGGICRDIFEYFHGASSLFDYMGWPTPLPPSYSLKGLSTVQQATFAEYGIYDRFSAIVYGNIWNNYAQGGDELNLSLFLRSLFSEIPLVFMPFKAYYLVWYWNYRDQLLETDILDPEEDEFLGDTITDNVILYCCIMRYRCWFKDTFTTALTNTGDGNLQVPVDFVYNQGSDYSVRYYNSDGLLNTSDFETAFYGGATVAEIEQAGIVYNIPMNYLRGSFVSDSELQTMRSQSMLSLDMFDRVRRLRTFVQKRLILGYEVDDVVYSSFMVKMSNVRIRIPEILAQGRDAVNINTVVNNTTTAEQIAGDKTATAFVHGSMSEMNYFSEEWGYYLQFKTILPIQSYAGGMQRLYLKTHPLDYMWPEFATMGMDAVYNCELAAVGSKLTDEQAMLVFGYQGRYYDLKSRMDEEHGRLLTDLNYLTFSREWDSSNPPQLNYEFVHCHPRLDGFVVDSPLVDVFRYDVYNASAWERRLPVPSEIVG